MDFDASRKASVLIVDDNPTNLALLFTYLNEVGFETLIAEDGEGAIRKADFASPDIILLDIMMPGIDGFETCRRLKEKESTKDIPIIFMTALSETLDKVKGFGAGAVDYITKPFQHEEVLLRLTTHLTIQQQKKELAELNAIKDKFFSIISHDMRNIFFYLMGSSDLLAIKAADFKYTKIEKDIENIKASLQNAHRVMENLLNWSLVRSRSAELKPENVDLHAIASRNVELFIQKTKEKGIHLSHSIKAGTMVHANPNMADTILRNLISNAVKFTARGEIKVSAVSSEEEKNFVEIAVADTGAGISKENIQKLFRIDQKYRKDGTAGEKGTGLGLILCKELVEKNKGSIWAESEIEKGTVFHFTLPAAEM